MKHVISTAEAPAPQGTYAQAVAARGEMVFISGQTPRRPDGALVDEQSSFEEMARQTMQNLDAVAPGGWLFTGRALRQGDGLFARSR